MADDPRKNNELQKIAVEESRLGIPMLTGFDVIHGLRTVYPIAIAEAGTFELEPLSGQRRWLHGNPEHMELIGTLRR